MIELAVRAVRLAGEYLISQLGKPKQTTHKKVDSGPLQPVSNVDRETELKIIHLIREECPDHNIIAEELGKIEQGSDYTWFVDSIDGTTQYIRRLPNFSVSVALQFKNEICLAAVYIPLLNELFTAERNAGAFLNYSKRLSIGKRRASDRILVASSTFASFSTQSHQILFDSILKEFDVRIYGSPAIDLCYVADGRLDLRIVANTKPWDHTAACLIAQESGCVVTDWYGKHWSPTSINILAGQPSIHTKALKLITANL